MKKLILTAVLASSVAFANAQTMTSKNGTPILPEAGDWSVGFDAAPALNLLNNSSGNTIDGLVPYVIVGKYVVDASTAYRARVGINFGSGSVTPVVTDSVDDASKISTSSNGINLGFGIQKYRGKGRLQGVYGAEIGFGIGGGKVTNEYLKAIDPTSFNSRVTETKAGSTFNLGLNGFIGAEYFFGAKMSLGAEYGWGLQMSSTGAGSTTIESSNGTVVSTKTTETGKSSDFNIGVMNPRGSLILSLYF